MATIVQHITEIEDAASNVRKSVSEPHELAYVLEHALQNIAAALRMASENHPDWKAAEEEDKRRQAALAEWSAKQK